MRQHFVACDRAFDRADHIRKVGAASAVCGEVARRAKGHQYQAHLLSKIVMKMEKDNIINDQ